MTQQINITGYYQVETLQSDGWYCRQRCATEELAQAAGRHWVDSFAECSEYRIVYVPADDDETVSAAIDEFARRIEEVQSASHTNLAGNHLHWFWSPEGRQLSAEIKSSFLFSGRELDATAPESILASAKERKIVSAA